MEATNNSHNFSSIDLDNVCSFEELYTKVNNAIAHLIWDFSETENVGLTKIVGEPLAMIQILMANQMKTYEQSNHND